MLKIEAAGEVFENLAINDGCVDSSFVKLIEGLGYDVELRLVKREEPTVDIKKGNARWHKQYLYKMTFPNGMVYIGTAYDISSRWANNGAGYRGQKVWGPIREFGWENIKREVLLYLPCEGDPWGVSDKIREEELRLIKEHEGHCYNEQGTKKFHSKIAADSRAKGNYDYKIWWEIDGINKPAAEWCKEYGKTLGSMQRRIHRWGLTPKQALTFPPIPKGQNKRVMEYWRECGCFDGADGPKT